LPGLRFLDVEGFLSFDLCSILASIGLLENSSVILVASMLISPLMVCK
jgi:uncharacterized membrane protein